MWPEGIQMETASTDEDRLRAHIKQVLERLKSHLGVNQGSGRVDLMPKRKDGGPPKARESEAERIHAAAMAIVAADAERMRAKTERLRALRLATAREEAVMSKGNRREQLAGGLPTWTATMTTGQNSMTPSDTRRC
jgi:di/tripeptidase